MASVGRLNGRLIRHRSYVHDAIVSSRVVPVLVLGQTTLGSIIAKNGACEMTEIIHRVDLGGEVPAFEWGDPQCII